MSLWQEWNPFSDQNVVSVELLRCFPLLGIQQKKIVRVRINQIAHSCSCLVIYAVFERKTCLVGCEICESCYHVAQLISQFLFGLACMGLFLWTINLKRRTINYFYIEFSDMYRFLLQLPLLVIWIVYFQNSTIKTEVKLYPYMLNIKYIGY